MTREQRHEAETDEQPLAAGVTVSGRIAGPARRTGRSGLRARRCRAARARRGLRDVTVAGLSIVADICCSFWVIVSSEQTRPPAVVGTCPHGPRRATTGSRPVRFADQRRGRRHQDRARRRPRRRPQRPAPAARRRGRPARRGGGRQHRRRRAAHEGAPADRAGARSEHARRPGIVQPRRLPGLVEDVARHGRGGADDAVRPAVRPDGARRGCARLCAEGGGGRRARRGGARSPPPARCT